jgi:hypothetical protein
MPFVIKARDQDDPRPNVPLTPMEQEVARIIRTHDSDLRNAAMSNAVSEALDARNIERVVEAFPWDASAEMINSTAETFGQVIQENIGKGFPSISFRGRFDFTDPRTIEWAKNQSAQLVTAVTDTTRNIIRETIAESFTQSVTVRDTARKLRNHIGLNQRQVASYEKFINNLDEQIRAGKITISQSRIMIDRQYKKMIKYRSEMIARQEILMAENHGRYLGFQQSIEQGWAHPKSMKRWSTSTDERTCDICMPMNGKSVQWDQSYPNGVFNPPAHIMCRCSISLLEPDSKLAQSFMPPAKIAPPILDLPLPLLPTLPIGNLRTPTDAVDSAFADSGKGTAFQYDAGEIEGLNVHAERVVFNGSPHTELRFKATDVTKTLLLQRIERDWARGDSTWSKERVAVLDKKRDGVIKFQTFDDGLGNSGDFEFIGRQGTTYTRYYPNGVAVRVISSVDDGFALDGQIKIMIPGKATPAQIQEVMKDLGITANRLPSQADIDLLRDNQILALFHQEDKKATGSLRDLRLKALEKKYGFSLSEITTEIDSTGRMRFIMPDKVTKAIIKETGKTHLLHDFNNSVIRYRGTDEQSDYITQLISGGRLQATTERYNGGVTATGLSEGRDIRTGGADYVFFSPKKAADMTKGGGRNTIVFKSDKMLNRTDWFAYSDDSYGVKNPNAGGFYMGTSSPTGRIDAVDYIAELKTARGAGEVMFLQNVDLNDVEGIYLSGSLREATLRKLREKGMIMWFDGRELEDVIRLSAYDLTP